MSVRCAGCRRELEIGDQFIEGSAGDYLGEKIEPEIGSLIADVMGGYSTLDGQAGGKIVYCEDCTVPGGSFRFETYYGDEEGDE